MQDNLKIIKQKYKNSRVSDETSIFYIGNLLFVGMLLIMYVFSIYYKNSILRDLLENNWFIAIIILYVVLIPQLKKCIGEHLIFKIIFWKFRFTTLFFLIIGMGLFYLFSIEFGENYDNILMAWITLYGIIIALSETTYSIKESNMITRQNFNVSLNFEDKKMALQTLNRILEHLYSIKGNGICSWVLEKMTKDYIIVDYPKILKCKYLNNKYKNLMKEIEDIRKKVYNGEDYSNEIIESIYKREYGEDQKAQCYIRYVYNQKKIENIKEDTLNDCLDYENELVFLNTIAKESRLFYEKHYFYFIPELLQQNIKNLAKNCEMNSIQILKKEVKKALDDEITNKFEYDNEFNKIKRKNG
ncbi:MAG: hypothetical protein LBM96_00250 [Methanobrevibacter sp.]|nr:hypothetical protein [Candidatus Methanoflexus mossambicus]